MIQTQRAIAPQFAPKCEVVDIEFDKPGPVEINQDCEDLGDGPNVGAVIVR